MRFQTRTISQGDTIEALALVALGTTDRTAELVALNRLRWPYISDDPAQKLGTPLETRHLAQNFASGRWLALDGGAAQNLAAGNWLLLRGVGGLLGQGFYDTAVIAGTGRLTTGGMAWSAELLGLLTPAQLAAAPTGPVVVYLTGGPQHSYGAGTAVVLYANPAELTTQVLATGDLLYLPLDNEDPNVYALDAGNLTSLLGADIGLDPAGRLLLSGGDLGTVSAAANMTQAIRLRATTSLRRLVMHPEYGNGLLAYLGSTDPNLIAIAYAQLSQCLLGDPRIYRVVSLRVNQNGDALDCAAQVMLRDRTVLSLQNLVLQLGLD